MHLHPPPFELSQEARPDGSATLSVSGELDIATASELRRAVGALMGVGTRRLELDLSAMTFIDSSGLGALLWAAHRLEAVGGELLVTRPAERVAAAIELAGLSQLIRPRG
jgi:anti-anti-sigma factor